MTDDEINQIEDDGARAGLWAHLQHKVSEIQNELSKLDLPHDQVQERVIQCRNLLNDIEQLSARRFALLPEVPF